MEIRKPARPSAGGLPFCRYRFSYFPGVEGALVLRHGSAKYRNTLYWWTVFRAASDGGWEAIFLFGTFHRQPQEFFAVNPKCAEGLDSLIVKQVLVNLRTDGGTRTETIPNRAALNRILREHFSIDL